MHKPNPKDSLPKDLLPLAAEPCPYTPPDSTPASVSASSSTTLSKLNPLNFIPSNLSNAPLAEQSYSLPLSRELSTIPKGDGSGNWEYPSPQQMYNAMLRKGYTDTPADAVESMVHIHNFLNEGAWAEILEWERRFGRGLAKGWQECQRGEMGTIHSASTGTDWKEDAPPPQLVKFMGKPGELTPRARMLQIMAWVFPKTFATDPPFDRHDWIVKRTLPGGSTKDVRYVIDYYSGPPEPTGEPVFYLDVRPAVDTPSAAAARAMRWGRDVWYRGTGAEARQGEDKS
jgi:cytochrome c heme-lyase